MATELSSSVAANYAPQESSAPQDWLPRVVHDTTEASLALGAMYPQELASAEDSSTREALRRRLAGADPDTWVAVGLHHLAGYPIDRTAALMGSDQASVERLCAPFAPPPGVSWESLGDPLGREAGPVRRGGKRKSRFPLYPVIAAVVVLALAIWAATSVGERPSFATAGDDPTAQDGSAPVVEPGGALFDPTLDPLPSAGCEAGAATAGGSPVTIGEAATAQVDIRGVAFPYRVRVPASEQPAPLVVSLADENTDPAAFQAEAQLEDALPGSIHITAPSLVPGIPSVGSEVVPVLVEDTVAGLCVDMGRVFVVGHGRGGPEAAAAVCSVPELLVGSAMVAAAPVPESSCLLDPHAAVLVAARDDDPTVDTGDALAGVGTQWAELVEAGDEVVDGVDESTLLRRWSGPGNVTVTTRNQTTGGHAWSSLDTTSVVEFTAGTARRLG